MMLVIVISKDITALVSPKQILYSETLTRILLLFDHGPEFSCWHHALTRYNPVFLKFDVCFKYGFAEEFEDGLSILHTHKAKFKSQFQYFVFHEDLFVQCLLIH